LFLFFCYLGIFSEHKYQSLCSYLAGLDFACSKFSAGGTITSDQNKSLFGQLAGVALL
jgi:hypothetical protein